MRQRKLRCARFMETFFCLDDILDIETSRIGRRYLQDDLMAALSVFDLNRYFGNVSAEQFASLLLR